MPGYCRDLTHRKTQPYSGPNPIQARWRHPEDTRVRREKSFPTKREARRWLAEQDADAGRGVWVDPLAGRETVAAIAALWQEATRHQVGPKTREGYGSILNRHLLPEFGPRRVSGIDAADVQRFANKLADRRSPKTVRNVLVVLSALLDFAIVGKYIVVNPCASVRIPTARRQAKIRPLEPDQLLALADAMPDAQSRAAVLVAGYCGLRAGEVWALRKNDIGIRRLRVDEKITEAPITERETGYTLLSNGLAIGPTKTYSDEPVAMPDFVAEALASLITPDMADDDFIFRDSAGGPVRHSNWSTRVWSVYRPAGVRFHDLRHTCAAYMIKRGFHPKVIQTQMRHEDIRTTMNVYGHLYPDGLDPVAEAFDADYRQRLQGEESSKVARINP